MSAPQIRQGRLFSTDTYQANGDYDPHDWVGGHDIVHHSSRSDTMPTRDVEADGTTGQGFHTGSMRAATERISARPARSHLNDYSIHPLQITGQHSLATRPVHDQDLADPYLLPYKGRPGASGTRPTPKTLWGDEPANFSVAAREDVEGGKSIPYVNSTEAAGSVSYRSPRGNLKTWGEAVKADPNAPSVHKATVAHGYDLSYPMSTAGEGSPSGDMQLQMNLDKNTPHAGNEAQLDKHYASRGAAAQPKLRLRRGAS